ncbi:MAG: hypothetical protein IPJ06_11825 [Saprospiraceae bacterium]|nr:hypothetical protein [Saprospiraceae bacterium]
MRLHYLPFLLLLPIFSGCLKENCVETRSYTIYTPIYKQADELRDGVGIEPARPLNSPERSTSMVIFC